MSKKFLYPGHNYLGPGNPLENGPVVNEADLIAKEHDYAYAYANSKDDVFNADRQAIDEFVQDFKKNPNLPSLAGAAGLGVKHFFEKSLNKVVYPRIPGNASS